MNKETNSFLKTSDRQQAHKQIDSTIYIIPIMTKSPTTKPTRKSKTKNSDKLIINNNKIKNKTKKQTKPTEQTNKEKKTTYHKYQNRQK